MAPRFQCGENIFSGHIILNKKLAPGFRGGENIFSGHIILNKELASRFQCGENIFSGHIILNRKLAPGFRGGEVTEYFGCTSHTVSPATLLKFQTKFKIEIVLERFTLLRNKKNM